MSDVFPEGLRNAGFHFYITRNLQRQGQVKKYDGKNYSLEGIELEEIKCIHCGCIYYQLLGMPKRDVFTIFLKCLGCGHGFRCETFSLTDEIPIGKILDCMFEKSDFEKELELRHQQNTCSFCDETFTFRQDLYAHEYKEHKIQVDIRNKLEDLYRQYREQPEGNYSLNEQIELLEGLLN